MAKTTAPLLSFEGSGTVAKTLVYGSWRGRQYARRHVIPSNPQTAGQTTTRQIFAWTGRVWKTAPTLFRAPWERFAEGQPLTARNAFIGQNIVAMRTDTNLANMIFSPGAKGGLAPDSVSAAGGAGQITVTFTTPSPPSGWALQAVIAAAIVDQDPQTGTQYVVTAGEDTTDPKDTVTLSGLTAGTYRVGGWTRWTKPDGSIAYGASLNDTATVT